MPYDKFTRFEITAEYNSSEHTAESIRDFFIDKVLKSNFDILIEELETDDTCI